MQGRRGYMQAPRRVEGHDRFAPRRAPRGRARALVGMCAAIAAMSLWLGPGLAQAASASPPAVFAEPSLPGAEGAITLRGSVNPNGSAVSDCHFEYGLGESYGSNIACTPEVGGGSLYVPVTAALTGLPPGTYSFRLSATNEGGTTKDLGLQKFIIAAPPAPQAFTYGTYPGETTATLQGYVTANGYKLTDCHFDYGSTSGYGASVPCAQALGNGSYSVSAAVGGLTPSTTYHVRLVASNAGGTGYGSDVQFSTYSPPFTYTYRPVAPITTYYPTQTSTTTYPPYYPSYRKPPCKIEYNHGRRKCKTPYRGMKTDIGLSVYYCTSRAHHASVRASAASTSEAGWPAKECLKMDKGPAGQRHTIVGLRGVHNWLLGGYGNDTIIGGNIGDVLWADYQPEGQPRSQTAWIHAGNGRNVIYANDTHNYVWTGTNPKTVVHAHVSGISGVIHCQSPGIVVFLSSVSERHFQLDGCRHISHFSVGY